MTLQSLWSQSLHAHTASRLTCVPLPGEAGAGAAACARQAAAPSSTASAQSIPRLERQLPDAIRIFGL